MKEKKKQYALETKRNDVNEEGKIVSIPETVIVSKEVYYAYMRSIWAERKRQQRAKRCRGAKGVRCQGDCAGCKYQNEGGVLSLELVQEKDIDIVLDESSNPENYVIRQELSQALYDAINTLESRDKEIIMLFAAGTTERKIAEQVNLSQSRVNRRKEKIVNELRELLKDYR